MRQACAWFFFFYASIATALPRPFVYLETIDASILQEIRYAGDHNLVGRPIKGYAAPRCILTEAAAKALSRVQKNLLAQSLSLKVYDCYRPQRASDDFWQWSQAWSDTRMQAEFYPRVHRANLFQWGYIAHHSAHSRGSTVDLTIVPLPARAQPPYHSKQRLIACTAPYHTRFPDSGVDMGTGYDCLDTLAQINNLSISKMALANRMLLQRSMLKQGFLPYSKEWWHFSLADEPFPNTYFDFLVY